LEKLEAGISVKIGDKDINQLYKEKLNEKLDLKETMSKTLSKPTPKIKAPKQVKVITEKGKKASAHLSKYRQDVKEALELKKNLENRNLISYSDADDDDDDDDEVPKALDVIQTTEPIVPKMPEPMPMPIFEPQIKIEEPKFDLTPIYGEIESLKKKNKDLEDKFMLRNSFMDISNMRRHMSIKF